MTVLHSSFNTPVQLHKNLQPPPRQYTTRTFASLAADTDSDDDLPIAPYDDEYDENDMLPVFSSPSPLRSSPSPLPLNTISLPLATETSHHGLLPTPDITPRARQRQLTSAVDCMVTMATLVGQWNTEWGPVSEWARRFTDEYLAAIEERRIVAFVNGILQKIRSGRVLMEDVNSVITECTLPTSPASMSPFIQLVVRLVTRLTSGVTILDDRLRTVKTLLDSAKLVCGFRDRFTYQALSLTRASSF